MNSSLFNNQLITDSFWQKPIGAFPSAADILHQGRLLTQSDNHLVPSLYILTKHFLIKVEEKEKGLYMTKVGTITWVTILPFSDIGNSRQRCGFTIKHGNEIIDFYTVDLASLEPWLTHLEELSILQNIRNDYNVGDVIGSGGQSVVRLGTSLETGEKVAIKSYEKQLLQRKPKHYEALVSEITVLRELSHPNIVKLYRVYESTLYVHLVLEHISGTELYECLKADGKFSQPDASNFMWNLLDTLQYLEERNVVHRDLKPENIILTDPTDKSQFKLLDFGLAMKYEGIDVFDSCGSPGYIAPEILMKRKHGQKVDIYSAGILFYILLSGYSPFSSDTRAETLKKNCENDISFGCDWLQIDSKFVEMIGVMTNFNPELRPPIKDLKLRLRPCAALLQNRPRRASTECYDMPGEESQTVPQRDSKPGKDAMLALAAAKEYHRNRARRVSLAL